VYTVAQALAFQGRLPRGIRPRGMLLSLAVPTGDGVPRTTRHLALDAGSFENGQRIFAKVSFPVLTMVRA